MMKIIDRSYMLFLSCLFSSFSLLLIPVQEWCCNANLSKLVFMYIEEVYLLVNMASSDMVKVELDHALLLVGVDLDIGFLSLMFASEQLGLADTLATSNSSDQKDSSKKSSGGSTWLEVLLICLGLVAVGAFSVFLFKLWQRKKREEQHARLLRLFEQDDELEVELGIRD
ncbi:hypothetical protein SASPL_150321 [Salvia splendens]|uniref:Transmembrane protein n=1 Tax=Salvia splendens TaxID=180675 RepID=A0A8X8W6D3_SALSN|nr:hypothetical protein SASPL_150321 [Salvia splendens]